MNEIKEGLEEATKKELAKRKKTHDEVERNAFKNLSERYNVEMESGFAKEWEDCMDNMRILRRARSGRTTLGFTTNT